MKNRILRWVSLSSLPNWHKLVITLLTLEAADELVTSPLLELAFHKHFWAINITFKVLEFLIAILLNKQYLKAKIFCTFTKKRFKSKSSIFATLFLIYFGILLVLQHPSRIPEAITVGLIAAVPEEFIWRGMVLGSLASFLSGSWRKRSVNSLIISSILFGLYHLSNLQVQPLNNTLAQIIQTIGLGTILGATYIKTSNILAPMFLHFFWDFFITLANGINFNSMEGPDWMTTAFVSCVLIAIGLSILLSGNKKYNLVKKLDLWIYI